MAILAYRISKRGRQGLMAALISLSVIQCLFSLGIIIIGSTGIICLASKLHSEDQRELLKICIQPIIYGLLDIIIYTFIVYLSCKFSTTIVDSYTGQLMLILNLSTIVVLIMGIVLVCQAWSSMELLERVFQESFHRGMGRYFEDILWKRILDKMQQELGCCGTHGYHDWHKTSWIHLDYVRGDSHTVLHYMKLDGQILPPVVPWSCCNARVVSPCFHDMLQQSKLRNVWIHDHEAVLKSIHKTGCLTVIRRGLDWGLQVMTITVTIMCILQLMMMPVARYLYTSARNASLLGNPKSSAYGWLIGRGDCYYHRGRTLTELEENRSQTEEDNKTEDADKRKRPLKARDANKKKKKLVIYF